MNKWTDRIETPIKAELICYDVNGIQIVFGVTEENELKLFHQKPQSDHIKNQHGNHQIRKCRKNTQKNPLPGKILSDTLRYNLFRGRGFM